MSKQEIIRVSDDMIQGSEYVYKDDFRFQRLSKDGKWYVNTKIISLTMTHIDMIWKNGLM